MAFPHALQLHQEEFQCSNNALKLEELPDTELLYEEYLRKPKVKGVGDQKQGSSRNTNLLAPTVTANITHSLTPRQINRTPYIKGLFT